MKIRLVALGASLLLAAAGCRTDPNTVLLERELRLQEDEIFRLRDCLEDCQAALESARRKSAALEQGSGDGVPGIDLSLGGAVPDETPGRDEAPGFAPPAPARPMPPSVELEEPAGSEPAPSRRSEPRQTPGSTAAPSDGSELEEAPRWSPSSGAAGSGSLPQPLDGGAARGGADSTQVARVLVNRALSGGFDADGNSGDEGVIVVVEPRDRQDRYLAAPGDVAVVLLDPTLDARIARWDFSAAETARMFHDSTFGRGMQLEMTWPGEPPKNRDLHVFVRYSTADGRQLDVDQPIRVEPGGRSVAGWSPREPRPAPGVTSRAPASASTHGRPTPADPATRPRNDDDPSSRTATRPDRPAWSPDRP
jgi:hypothetical protein